jgi:hypothetical protein
MSSPRTARTNGVRRRKPAHPTAKAADAVAAGTAPSAVAMRLAATVERGLARGQRDILTPKALQALMAAALKAYAAQVEAGGRYLPLTPRSGVNDTVIMVTASALLRAANLQVFDLGMWQSWTGR